MSQSAMSRLLDAAPFRAHAQHLLEVSGLPLPALAVAAGVPVRALSHLVHGRSGRHVTRIEASHASALFSITATSLVQRCTTMVAAAGTRSQLQRLRLAGWADHELARCVGVTPDELHALIRVRIRRCPGAVALRTAALMSTWETTAILPTITTARANGSGIVPGLRGHEVRAA